MSHPGHVVVAGAGLAGLRVVEELRRHGFVGRVTMVGAEHEPPYDRPPLSKAVLTGAREHSHLMTPADLEALDLDLRTGQTATGLDVEALLVGGERLPYDALVIATGARARTLPGLEDALVLRTLDDARRAGAAIRASGQVTVVGGGFIGCEVASSAVAMGASATLVELQPQPLQRVLGPAVAAEVAALHREAGVELRVGVSVTGRAPDGDLSLSDGSTAPGSTVVVGLGVVPEVDWLAGSGLDADTGVRADERGRTSLERVWAVGDVAAWWRPALGRHVRVEHWDAARTQAEVVARDLLGLEPETASTPALDYFWSDQHGLKLQVLGRVDPDDDVTVMRCGPKQRLVAVYGRDGVATAVLAASMPRTVMGARALLSAGAPYDEVVAWAAS